MCNLHFTNHAKKRKQWKLQRFRYSSQHPTQQINLLQLLAITMRNQSIFFRAELELHSKELAQLSGWARLYELNLNPEIDKSSQTHAAIPIENHAKRVPNKPSADFTPLTAMTLLHTSVWVSSEGFSALVLNNLAKRREQCVPPFASLPAIVSSKQFGPKVIKVNCNEQVNYFQIMGAMNKSNWIFKFLSRHPFSLLEKCI